MKDKLLPIGYGHCYIRDVINLARQMQSKAYFEMTPELKTVVSVDYIFKNTMPHIPIIGIGTGLESACEDYMRQCRGEEILHVGKDIVKVFI